MKIRTKILQHINANLQPRLGNMKRGVATKMDKELVNEALGFRSLCLFSGLDDKELAQLWDNSNLEHML